MISCRHCNIKHVEQPGLPLNLKSILQKLCNKDRCDGDILQYRYEFKVHSLNQIKIDILNIYEDYTAACP